MFIHYVFITGCADRGAWPWRKPIAMTGLIAPAKMGRTLVRHRCGRFGMNRSACHTRCLRRALPQPGTLLCDYQN